MNVAMPHFQVIGVVAVGDPAPRIVGVEIDVDGLQRRDQDGVLARRRPVGTHHQRMRTR
jgi:hypothetical protein